MKRLNVRPWLPGEVPVGKVIRHKKGIIVGGVERPIRLLITAENGALVTFGGGEQRTFEGMLKKYVMDDGSPCGVEVS